MRKPLEIRPLALGFIIGIGLIACLGAGGMVGSPTETTNRFTMVANESHVFVLDTMTGEVWEKFAPNGNGETSSGFNEPKIDAKSTKQTRQR
jgi:glucose dehydrogenase